MRKNHYLILLFSILFFSVRNSFSQQDSAVVKLSSFVQDINTFSMYIPQEKVYLHTDNTDYFLSETIWFKAYVVSSRLHKPTHVSKVLYVELLTPEGEVVETKRCEIIDGQCHGNIYLDTRKFYSGFYELRAYTRYMTNFEKEIVFSRIFPIYSFPEENNYDERKITGSEIAREHLREQQPKQNNINVDFFPEGGSLVAGLQSRVAFKATNKNGKSINAEGTVYNSKNEAVAVFSTQHQGMGVFSFRPQAGENYTAKIKSEKRTTKVDLPRTESAGYVMSADNVRDNRIIATIQKTAGLSNEVLGLALLMRGEVYHFSAIEFTQPEALSVEISNDELPAGVAQLVLFNQAGHVLADRLVFNRNDENYLSIQTPVLKTNYAPFEKVNLNFTVLDYQNNPVETVFSLSVKDKASTLEPVHKDNILTYLLLSSELKGMIEQPAFYFESDDRAHRFALDLLLMTQGWRRYKWNELTMQCPFELKQPVENTQQIDGVIKNRVRETPKAGMELELMMFQRDSTGAYGDNHIMGFSKTDSLGRFTFKLPEPLYGQWESIIQARKKGQRKKFDRIMLNRFFSPSPAYYPAIAGEFRTPFFRTEFIPQDSIPQVANVLEPDNILLEKQSADMSERITLLQEVEITAKSPERKREEKLSSSLIVYDVNEKREDIIDKGELLPDRVVDFLKETNPNFRVNYTKTGLFDLNEAKEPVKTDVLRPSGKADDGFEDFFVSDKGYYAYGARPVMFILNNKPLIDQAWKSVDNLSMSYIEKIVISMSPNAQPKTIYNTNNEYDVEQVIDVRYLELEQRQRRLPPNDYFTRDTLAPKLRSDIVYIFLHTKPDYKSNLPSRGVRTTLFDGYAVPREFFSPRYAYELDYDENDHRRTLYWNPNVKTNAAGHANVEFYNNASSTEFMLNAETVTPDGKIGVAEK